MSMLRRALILAVCFVLGRGGLSAATGSLEPAPVGYWELRNTEGILMLLVNVDGTGDLNRQPFRWTYEGGVLTLVQPDKTMSYDAAFTQDELSLSGGNLRHPVTLGFTMMGKKYDPAVAGVWSAEGGETIELAPGGVGSNGRGPFRYTAMDGFLAYADPSISFTIPYRLAGDRLELTTSAGKVTFVRAAKKEEGRGSRAGKKKAPRVVVNGEPITSTRLEALMRDPKLRILDGNYWYDRKCGAWGSEGGPTLGYVPPDLDLGGTLRSIASTGGTGIWINGRELHPKDFEKLKEAIGLEPGRYWLDAKGNLGFEGNESPFSNLASKAQMAQFSAGGRYRDPADITGIRRQEKRESHVMGPFLRIVLGD